MSDTPRTDEEILDPEVVHQDSHSEGWVSIDFARQLERELQEAQARIRLLIAERDSARQQADQNWKLREEFTALLGTSDVKEGVREVTKLMEAKQGAARYETVRRMTLRQFIELFRRCITKDLRFDDEVDRVGGLTPRSGGTQ